MDKQFLKPIEMLAIATQHAYCAEYLLKQNAEVIIDNEPPVDVLLPITSLIYQAFELTLKAYLLQDHQQVRQYKSLLELIELNHEMDLSSQEIQLITSLSRQQAFRKGVDYSLWENSQQLHVFCERLMTLYARLQELMPLELQSDYQ
jgi:hypothetical protein